MAIAVRYVLPLVLCQLVVPVVMDFSREVTGARRLEMEDTSAQGAMVNSTTEGSKEEKELLSDIKTNRNLKYKVMLRSGLTPSPPDMS